ncbi:MAG: hypothetical protein IPL79_19375 [Myxococcales bacterium]|nr:hypothetical protein [Myxococcales bacterium]
MAALGKTFKVAVTYGALAAALGCSAGCDDGAPGPVAYFATEAADHATPATFWNAPFPAAWRMTEAGTPDLTGYPLGGSDALANLAQNVSALRGVPVIANVYFRLQAMPTADALATQNELSPVMTTTAAPIVFINVDAASPELGRVVPSVAMVLPRDNFAPDFVLAVAPAPGIVLLADTTYAVAVLRSIGGLDAAASFRKPPPAIADALAPLWPALAAKQIDRGDVVVATVFKTGDVVGELAAQHAHVRQHFTAEILSLEVAADGAGHDGICELVGMVRLPQFQNGTPPFSSEGDVALDAAGMPIQTGTQDAPFTLTLPKQTMPEAGWPLQHFMHGSGSRSTAVIDAGPSLTADGEPVAGKGPSYVVGLHGMAALGTALPLNPERLPGASDYEYLNLSNLAAMPSVFAQGVFEQGLLLDAIVALQLSPKLVAACDGVALPLGVTTHGFDAAHLTAGGQSMGGVYTNMLAAVDERIVAIVPTGAGGLWHKMALQSQEIPGGRALLANVIRTQPEFLSFLHPAMGLLALSWARVEPMAYMARVAYDPLPQMPVRHIFEPVGYDDSFFSPDIYDAAALAYGNQLAGTPVWDSMTAALALAGLDDVAALPLSGNRTNRRGEAYTGVVVQYTSDGLLDAHYIWRQRADLKAQYGAFLAAAGQPTPAVPAP